MIQIVIWIMHVITFMQPKYRRTSIELGNYPKDKYAIFIF